jgi:hypothetical protein
MQKRPNPGEVLVANRLTRLAQLIDYLLHANCIPHNGGITEQAEAASLVHNFVEIAIPKLTPVGEEKPAGQGVPCLASVEL